MERPTPTMLRIGEWCVNPASGQISRNQETVRVEARTMRLLLCLADHAGEVVSIDELLNQVWSGVSVSPDSAYQAVATLRRVLGDDPKQPTYIATVPRLGYRMVATVTPWTNESVQQTKPEESGEQTKTDEPVAQAKTDHSIAPTDTPPTPNNAPVRSFTTGLALAAAALCLALLVALAFNGKKNNRPAIASERQKSIAVLPFLDLTQGMKNEEFADGMTEELIDKLSKIPGLRVPSPTSSFFFKGKQISVADVAKTLGVAYVLDGSVRKSGTRVRIAARLIRADNVYVIWSETYDRPFDDILKVQDDIAGEVTKALRASIEARPNRN